MTHHRSTRLAITLAALGLAGIAGLPAVAESGSAEGARCERGHHGHHRPSPERFAQRQQELHDALQLRADQEPAWADFAAVIQPPEAPEMDRDAVRALPAPERMKVHMERMEAHLADMKRHLEAVEAFYALLTPEQQKVFDAEFGPKPHRWGGRKEGAQPEKTSGSTGSDGITVI